MSFSVTKSINKSSIPLKGDAEVTITVNMESELAQKPRDILIAWDYFGREISNVYLNKMSAAIGTVLSDLVGLSGGSGSKLGNGSRVALYGNRSNTGEIRTALTDDTAVIIAALDEAKANPQPGLPVAADSMVDMLKESLNRKTVLICGLSEETALMTAERDKLSAAGIEIFTMGEPRSDEAQLWGGLRNSSVDAKGPAPEMAGMPQNLGVEDYIGQQFKVVEPVSATSGDFMFKTPVIGKPKRMSWEVGPPEPKTGAQTQTLKYTAVNIGPDGGEQIVSTAHVTPLAYRGAAIGEEISNVENPELKLNVTADPNPGTDPDPTPGGGTDPEPTPGGGTDPDPAPDGIQAENWPAATELTVGHCKDAVQATIPNAQIVSLGRLVQLDVVLKNICPGKRVSATILLTEKNDAGDEETRAMKHILVPAQTGTVCADVKLRCIQFSVPEALDLSGDPSSICNERKFNVRVIANYVDSDMIFCDTSTVTV